MPLFMLTRRWLTTKVVIVGLLIHTCTAGAAGTDALFSASAEVSGGAGRVALDLYSLPGMFAEFRMVMRFTGIGGSTSFELLEDTGGHTRLSLYTTPSADIVVLGAAGRDVFFDAKTATARKLDIRVDAPLTYIGAFDFVRDPNGNRTDKLRLITPEEQPECIPTMADWAKPGPNRTEAYRVTCR